MSLCFSPHIVAILLVVFSAPPVWAGSDAVPPAPAMPMPLGLAALIAVGAALLIHIWHSRRWRRQRAENQKLTADLALARMTLDTVPFNIFWYDSDFKVVQVNEAALSLIHI